MDSKKPRKNRNRATALVFREGRLLLVRERGAKHWSLPGGGMKDGEDPVAAAIRELHEETKLVARSATYLFLYESPSQHHHVCCLEVEGERWSCLRRKLVITAGGMGKLSWRLYLRR